MAQKTTSCGVIVTDGERLLLGHATRSPRWDIPKGIAEPGESLAAAARRELFEETGLEGEVGRLLLVCESVDPQAPRHIVHVAFLATVRQGGALRPGHDGRLVDAAWLPIAALTGLPLFPAIAAELQACHAEGFAGPVRYLGDVWRDMSAGPSSSATLDR